MNTVEVTRSLDQDGIAIAEVPLTNSDRKVVLYLEDWWKLKAMGVDPRWRISSNLVLERGRARLSISRLIANAREGEKVMYLDKDPCNLRRDNLATAEGAAKFNTKDKQSYRQNFLKEKVEIKYKDDNPSYYREDKLDYNDFTNQQQRIVNI